jgi:hypothetical protein
MNGTMWQRATLLARTATVLAAAKLRAQGIKDPDRGPEKPFYAGKHNNYEGAARAPLILAVPDRA